MTDIRNPEDLASFVLARRKELFLTQIDAAGLCGVGVRFLSDLENGKETLQLGKVLLVLARLGIVLKVENRR